MTEAKRIFLDTTPIIYFLDNDANYGEKVASILNDFFISEKQIITSVITCSEYLPLPYRSNNIEKEFVFFEFLNDCQIPIYPINLEISKISATIRANYKHFKGMDSLQLATAIYHNCDLFLTNDKQLRQFKEIRCLTLDDL